jgi:trigger factor
MKINKLLALAVAVILCAGALASCQLSKLFRKDKDNETAAETNAASDAMDFYNADLTQYIKLGQYKGIAITVDVPELTDDDFNQSLNELLSENGYYEQVTDRAPVPGDTVNIDYEGYIDGKKFDGGSAEDQTLELSENSGYIDGFAEGLVGVMPGTTVTLNLTFPADYYEDLAGKAVTFNVTVNYVHGEYMVPELNDEFVVKYTNGEYTTVEAFKEYYRAKLEADLAAEAENEAYTELWQRIVENAEVIQYPQQQVLYYFNAQKSQYESYAASNSIDYNTMLSYMGVTEESMMESARSYTKEDLVFYSIVKAEGFSISDSEYASGAAGYAEQAGATVAQLEAYYGKDYITECLLWDKVLKQLFIWADVAK